MSQSFVTKKLNLVFEKQRAYKKLLMDNQTSLQVQRFFEIPPSFFEAKKSGLKYEWISKLVAPQIQLWTL